MNRTAVWACLCLTAACQVANGRDVAGTPNTAAATDGAQPIEVPQVPPPVVPGELQEAAQQIQTSRSTAIVRAASRVSPAVVTVNTLRTQQVRPRSMWESFFLAPGAARRVPGLGSGFVIDGQAGTIVTNHHVVEGADRVMVTFPDGREFEAAIVGSDPVADVAVLSVDADAPLPEAPIGTSQGLLIGEWVVAIGNPFGYLLSNSEPTVTTGVVSAVGRHIVPSSQGEGFYLGMIQTDASINPGNSGGPLVNALGEVIGVNASIFSRSGGSEGLGFAIPIDRALRSARDLLAGGEIRRAWLGLDVEPVEADAWGRTRGVLVSSVVGGSPAQQAGLRAGGRILAANGRRLAAPLDWEDVILDLRPGDEVTLSVEGAQPVRIRAGDLPSLRAERVRALQAMQLISVTPQVRAERGVASEEGALIVEISDQGGSPLGFRVGDVIVRINDAPVHSADEAARLLDQLRPGRVRIVVERNGSFLFSDFQWRG